MRKFTQPCFRVGIKYDGNINSFKLLYHCINLKKTIPQFDDIEV